MSNFPGRTPTDLVHLLAPAYGSGMPELPGIAWGGYSIAYYTQAGDTLCSDCATVELLEMLADTEYPLDASDYPVIAEDTGMHDDDSDLTCDNCYKVLAEGYTKEDD